MFGTKNYCRLVVTVNILPAVYTGSREAANLLIWPQITIFETIFQFEHPDCRIIGKLKGGRGTEYCSEKNGQYSVTGPSQAT